MIDLVTCVHIRYSATRY